MLASAAVSIVILISYLFLYIAERKVFIMIWCMAMLMFVGVYVTRYFIETNDHGIWVILNHSATIGGYLLVYYGTCDFLCKKHSPIWIYVLSTALFIGIPVFFMTDDLIIASTPVSTVLSLMLFHLAVNLYRLKSVYRHERMILGTAFSLWATTILLYPFYYIIDVPIVLAYVLAGCSGLITAITLQGVYFRQFHDNMLLKDEKIKQYGMYDKLTGVFNRAYFEQELIRLDIASNLPLSVIIGDVNGLKLINDTFGHSSGDELLIDTVGILRSSLRKYDIIARLGGDEFIILLVRTGYQDALNTIERIEQNCRGFKPKTLPVHLSLGAAEKTDMDTSFEDVVKLADTRMYDEKLSKRMNTRRTMIDFLQKLLLQKDYQTESHVRRMKEMVTETGRFLGGLTDKNIEELGLAAELHDIGKIAVPEEILKKTSELTKDEWVLMKRHTDTGCRITQSCAELVHISEYILSHHEWWNGSGYPRGLMGDEIPLYSRIISIVDAYDVMTHDRPYQSAKSPEEALLEIKGKAGMQFDPDLVIVFEQMMAYHYGISEDSVMNERVIIQEKG